MTDKELQKAFCDVTGLTWDVKALIATAKTDAARKELLKKLVWMIPDGGAADLAAHEGAIASPAVKTPRIQLIEELSTRLGVDNLSKVFVDFNGDGDVDAYDVVTADDQKPKEDDVDGSDEEDADELPVTEPIDEQA